ncbi:MAG TPA: PAS domain-containing sensor histidine kinase [Acidimicrobiales bacterium]|nr:PAS domain-containing sensor histidine kinase [Acidimicrobiales bacterium]
MTRTESLTEPLEVSPDAGEEGGSGPRPVQNGFDGHGPNQGHPPSDEGPIARRVAEARRTILGSTAGAAARQEAALVLVEHVDRLEAMLRHTKDMITVLDENGLVMFSNAAAGRLTGHGEEVNTRNALDFIHPDDAQAAADTFDRCVETPGSFASAEIRIRHADVSWHYVDAYAENCLDGPVTGVVVSMRDVCDRRAGQETLQRANEAMRSFVAVASHDLRSPVAVIRGLAGTLAADWSALPDSERLDIAQMVARASERMGRLVENLLMISRLDSGVSAGRPRPVPLRDAVDLAVRHMEDRDSVRVSVSDDVVVMVDPEHLERMLTNYLHNAVNHGRSPVRVEATVAGALVELRVIDSGGGVPEEFVPRLFERFFRADAQEVRGTGLGLSIVRDLARAAGGDAWYEAGRGGGCFVMSLPDAQ